MNELISLRRPGADVGDRHELHADFDVEPFDLYGRHHEVTEAEADVGVTRLSEGLHLDLRVRVIVHTTCDRTLEPTELRLEFGDSEFRSGLDTGRGALRRANPAERGADADLLLRHGTRGAHKGWRRDRPPLARPRWALRF